jgi:hypothetical protein
VGNEETRRCKRFVLLMSMVVASVSVESNGVDDEVDAPSGSIVDID